MANSTYHGIREMAGGERFPETMVNELRNAFDYATSKLPSNDVDGLNYGLVSLWRFDDPTGTRRDSVGPNHLTENGGTLTRVAGKIGFAVPVASASSQWLSVPDNPSLLFTTAFSVSLWINQTDLAASRAIMGQWDYQTQGAWMIETDAASDEILVYTATSLTDAGVTTGKTTDANLALGTWYHIAVVYDGSQTGNTLRLKIYVNGALKTLTFAGTIPASLPNSTADLKFGKFGGTLTRYFNGMYDAARLYNRALTAAEVTTLYASGTGLE